MLSSWNCKKSIGFL